MSNKILSQNEYYDAIKLKGMLSNGCIYLNNVNKEKTFNAITQYYQMDSAKFMQNPILGKYWCKNTAWPSANLSKAAILGFYDGIKSSIGGLNVTTIADGLAKFLVERVKQELSMTFFNKFKEDLKSNPDLQILFPNTYNVLMSIDTEIYNFTAYIEMLREAFISDFQVMIPNLRKLIMDPRYEIYFSQNPKLKYIFDIGLLIADDLHNGTHPGDLLQHIANDSVSLTKIDPNLNASIQVLNLFIQSFRSKDPNRYLVSSDSINILLRDPIGLKIYLGLIYQKGSFIKFSDKNKKPIDFNKQLYTLYQYCDTIKDDWVRIKNILEEIVYKIEYAHNVFIKIKEKNKNPNPDNQANYKDYYAFYDASLNLVEYISDVPKLLKDTSYLFNNKDVYFYSARKLCSIYLDINNKRYASAILNLVQVYDTIFKVNKNYNYIVNTQIDSFKVNITKNNNSVFSIENQINYNLNISESKRKKLINQVKGLKDTTSNKKIEKIREVINELSSNTKSEVIQKIIKYGNFAALIAKAETSDDVKNAIESVALPVGSSNIKRNAACNFSVNAYTGFYIGLEKISEADNSFKFNSYGITAPVGFAFSKGYSFFFINTKKQWSTSLFVSVIDVGALAAFRFKNDTIAQVPTIQLKDIVSPGLFLSFGIPKTPLSINLGVQMGPNLRKVDSKTNDYSNNIYWRFSASVVVDIPIFNLYTKPK